MSLWGAVVPFCMRCSGWGSRESPRRSNWSPVQGCFWRLWDEWIPDIGKSLAEKSLPLRGSFQGGDFGSAERTCDQSCLNVEQVASWDDELPVSGGM